MDLTHVEIQDLLDCINEEEFERATFEAKMHGGKLKASRPIRRRKMVIMSRRVPTSNDLKASAHAEKLLKEMKDGKWQTRQ